MSDEEILAVIKFHGFSLTIKDFERLSSFVYIDEIKKSYADNAFKAHIISKQGNTLKHWLTIEIY